MNWRPSATFASLNAYADLLQQIRKFFTIRALTEVSTPLLGATAGTDPFITPFVINTKINTGKLHTAYLQTSPEYYMKRLLAAGSGSIFQICKAFRCEESGKLHNSEFTILEWYRLKYTHKDLMHEVDELLQLILNSKAAQYTSYQEIFITHLNINPHTISLENLHKIILQQQINIDVNNLDKDDCLNILFTHIIEPKLGFNCPEIIFHYPYTQAALSRIIVDENKQKVAARFEAFYKGVELANGFYELADPILQLERFEQDNIKRKKLSLPMIPIDKKLIGALKYGLPNCSGVALGVDRLLMLKLNKNTIDEVLPFPNF